MFYCIWQSHDLGRFDEFYSKDFIETIDVAAEMGEPLELRMGYEELFHQAQKQKEEYRDTTLEIKKIVIGDNQHISVNFYSSSIVCGTGEKRHRMVCGIWHLNSENKIDRVWAVVVPHYIS